MTATPDEGLGSFYKLSGAGNDFLAQAEPNEPPSAEQIRAWCRRGLSLGADGLFTLARIGDAVRMVHYNADGGRSDLCLNGSRCAAALAFRLGWAGGVGPEARKANELRLETDVGMLRARHVGVDRIALELPDFVGEPKELALEVGGKAYQGWLLSVGVPHFVLPWPGGLANAPVERLGSALRAHPDLDVAGANIDFVRFISSSPGRCELRTFERGVEAETLACGTGVVATVAAGIAAGELTAPAVALTAGGHELSVHAGPWVLEGDARILARVELLGGASAVPSTPAWT